MSVVANPPGVVAVDFGGDCQNLKLLGAEVSDSGLERTIGLLISFMSGFHFVGVEPAWG